MSEIGNKVSRAVLEPTKELLQIALLVAILVLVLSNWRAFDVFVERFLQNAVEVSVADVITVTITQVGEKSKVQNWAAFYRVTDGLRVDRAVFDDEHTCVEYVDLTALADVDLRNAYIGDGDEMLLIDEGDFFVHNGETVRIYTYISDKADVSVLPEASRRSGVKVLSARPFSGEPKDGIFKMKLGKGDRLVVIDRNQRILLDLDYWWVQVPAA